MNLRLFVSTLCLVAFPIILSAQSFENPLGRMNNSFYNTAKDLIFYTSIVSFPIAVIVFFIKGKMSLEIILLAIGSLVLYIVWLRM